MHDHSTRAMRNCRRRCAMIRSLAAATLFVSAAPVLAVVSTVETENAKPIPPAPYDLTVSAVAAGEEGVRLSARLEMDGGIIVRDILWRVEDEHGLLIAEHNAPTSDIKLPPGSYRIKASYGSARFSQMIDLAPQSYEDVNFLFNIGALRVLAYVEGQAATNPSRNLIYALDGPESGQLITISTEAGELVRLRAGAYRIESRFEKGNAVAVSDVRVQPGLISAVDITHHAGEVHLSLKDPANEPVTWRIFSATGLVEAEAKGAEASMVLKPGLYRAEARSGSQNISAEFEVSPGAQADVLLSP